ncbi:MauE/DoxX family redox-associated membrane protein [Paenibacillus alba]|uniref:Methylamine utilisation protein MauE domain-containing protein n=1 Tax=Paenibacillus alba TaxID=1197127 RepID=A0ABU6GDD7_9BACL|nr:MauE/DoxX family redox-associated membrane protein [Paenibacillus alba]MEC0231975.1 hypothetical protein [Paenibacillus alba]
MLHWLAYVLDMVMAILFFMPFYMKLLRFPNFRMEIYAYGILPRSLITLTAIVVAALEFILFLAFTSGLFDVWKELAAALLLGLFALFTWRKIRMTGIEACACYGEIAFLNRYPVQRNLILIGLLTLGMFLHSGVRDLNVIFNSLLFVMAMSFFIELVQFAWSKKKRREHSEQSESAVPM